MRPDTIKLIWRCLGLNRRLTQIACAILFVCVAPTNVIGVARSSCDNICLTPTCVHIASDLLKSVNESINPCENFYQFACGGYGNYTPIADDTDSVSDFELISKRLQKQLEIVMKEPIEITDLNCVKHFKRFYRSCTNTTAIKERGYAPLFNILRDLGGWPVLDGDRWNGTDFEWKETIHKVKFTGYPTNYFIILNIKKDENNNTKFLLHLDRRGKSREISSLTFDTVKTDPYYTEIVDVAVALGATRDRAEKEMLEVVNFEIELNSLPRSDDTTKMTIKNLTYHYPNILWKEYLYNLLPFDITVHDNETVIVSDLMYFEKFQKLIDVTPRRVQANYIMWQAVQYSLPHLNVTEFNDKRSRLKFCFDTTLMNFYVCVNSCHARKYFDRNIKTDINEIVTNVKEQLIKTLEKVNWLDEYTRNNALEKAKAISTIIAYPEELFNDTVIDDYYDGLNIDNNCLLSNTLNISRFKTEKQFSKLKLLAHESSWVPYSTFIMGIINAWHAYDENLIVLPPNIFQGAFFNRHYPKYMNYGSSGELIGHEFFHAYDVEGTKYNKNGTISDWWSPSVKQEFLRRTRCHIDQYSNYTVKEVQMNISGVLTLDENIADNGGFKIAYLAYINWLKQNGAEPKLPGLHYTNKQMFWISAAYSHCSNDGKAKLKDDIETNNHSPNEFRVIGSLSNIPEFAKDFNCHAGSKMNPENKCIVW